VLLPAVLALSACSDATGTGNTGQARVSMSMAGQGAALRVDHAVGDYVANALGALTVSQIDSMFVRVTSVSALRASADTAESSGGWVLLQLTDSGGKRINLLQLPRQGTDSIGLAAGALTTGNYKNIRLQFDSASAVIRLNQDVTVGGVVFTKGTAYSLRVPSGILKIPAAGFTVAADSLSTVNLVFDSNASVGTITATGSGVLSINPVIRSSK
ncbi:MAG TPA: DUF4382 domain-containing protein, partial [Longimicrobiales bacterium]